MSKRPATEPPLAHQEGRRAEDLACSFLRARGLKLIERNYRCRCGEIDLIMDDGDCLVFVEVRYRRSGRYGSGAETIDWRKRRRLVATAQHFLHTRAGGDKRASRFDVISVGPADGRDAGRIQWIQDAIEC